ncbi:MAG TPA: glutamate--tRNA ligase [Thermoplasmata archaeon]|nr:glutamate--tRNA ligase [Thermoplasmata archaeon]
MAAAPSLESRVRRLALANALEHGGEARASTVLAHLLAAEPELRARAQELGRTVATVVDAVGHLSPDEQRSELRALGAEPTLAPTAPASHGAEFPPLPGAVEGGVVLRLAPFPSGALHIGNARMLFVNQHYQERYRAKLLLVFDDTVGSEEKVVEPEMFDVIRHDLELAGVHPDQVLYKSDRIPHHYPWAREVIDRGAAYVCVCPAELLRENRRAGRACAERSQTLEATRTEWEGMLSGRYGPGEAVLRLRTDLADPDPAFRDRVLFRISDFDHPRVGHRYRVWPLLEFSWAVDDIELGITHVLRGKDLVMEDRMEERIWSILGKHGPPFLHWGLLKVREAKISKSKSYLEVKSGQYDGWADPRTWSIASLDRRGISREATRAFTLSFGMSLSDIEVPAETLYAENRSVIDGTTPRRAFVPDPVKVVVDGYPADLATVELPNHPDRPELGRRSVPAGPEFYLPRKDLAAHPAEEIRLKDLLNVRLPASVPEGASELHAQFTSRENRRLPRIQWAGLVGAQRVDVLDVDGSHRSGIAEATLATGRPRDIYQFERVGFVRVEGDWVPGTSPVRVVFGHP